MSYTLAAETPDVETYLTLRRVAGLSPFSENAARRGLPGSWHAVLLRHEGAPVGMGRIIGDGGCFFQVTDIAVHPDHRGKGLGKRIMAALMDHSRAPAPPSATITLMPD
ncbi:MAG: GNAT family N-acetyltransferase, partial [Rhodobacteraceae bacterium]|nr:GNAT family N-acetyltransferase [Paracoccaceae bacterium]